MQDTSQDTQQNGMQNGKNVALSAKLSNVSLSPGVYRMKDADGKIIYVGKALNLKKRLSSYFVLHSDMEIKTRVLVQKIADFDTIVTDSEKEALILEANLIKRFRPRYNVIFRDDKRYPSLRLDIENRFPCLSVVRKIANDKSLYFGPFASAYAVRQTLKVIHKTFKLRKCKTKEFRRRTRPCLNYQMGTCLGPCCLDVPEEVYNEVVKEVILFLRGRTPELIQKFKSEMSRAATDREYERAASLRDKIHYLETTLEKQLAVTTDFQDRDVMAVAREVEGSVITVLTVRNGFLLGSRHVHFTETIASDPELIETFIRHYYTKPRFIPKEIFVPVPLEGGRLLEEWLSGEKKEKVSIVRPQRGEKARLLKLAFQNAQNRLKELKLSETLSKDVLERLQKRLRLQRVPQRIECFDNSNIYGTHPVASMVVFQDGKADKSSYRRYKIKTVSIPDDYASMAEVLTRRYGKGEGSKPYPDLLVVDGGKGQLNIAQSVLRNLSLESAFDVVGIAKKDIQKGETADKVFKPNQANPVSFGKDRDLLLFVQRVRDEAHRFAITFHRSRRSNASLQSVLDSIPGVGKKRKALLLKHFGSIKNIREATFEELLVLPGITRPAAEAIRAHLDMA